MKKPVTILLIIVLSLALAAPVAGAGERGHGFRSHGHHHHRHYYHSSGDDFWFGLGMGVLTGAIVSSFYYAPPPSEVYYPPSAVVVSPPPAAVPPQRFGTAQAPAYGQVVVTAAALNIRSGPSLDHAIAGSVRKGDVLSVIDSVPDWFYIRDPNGRYGWVMDRYTRPTQPLG